MLTASILAQAFVQLPIGQIKHELFQSQRLDELTLPQFSAVRERALQSHGGVSDTEYTGSPYRRELRQSTSLSITGE